MFRNYEEIKEYLLKNKVKKTAAVACAHDDHALPAVVSAHRMGILDAILVGKTDEIKRILAGLNEPAENYVIVESQDEVESAKLAVSYVREGKADILIKGLLMTANYMRAILNKETGIMIPGAILSSVCAMELKDQNRFILITDAGVTINPGFEEKKIIIKNAVRFGKIIGMEMPKVALLSALEKVNPKMPHSEEAGELAKLTWDDCYVEGPYALDNAVSPESCKHKGITGKVAGQADVLVTPDINSGNILYKALDFIAGFTAGGLVMGTTHPVIMASRSDSAETKENGILLAILACVKRL